MWHTSLSDSFFVFDFGSGEIPESIGQLVNLQQLYLTFNKLSGKKARGQLSAVRLSLSNSQDWLVELYYRTSSPEPHLFWPPQYCLRTIVS
jgi:hypothetical protein